MSDREEFEKWALKHDYILSTDNPCSEGAIYNEIETCSAFFVWRAVTKASEAKLLQAEARIKELSELITKMIDENAVNRKYNSTNSIYNITVEHDAIKALSTQPSTDTLDAYVEAEIKRRLGNLGSTPEYDAMS